MSAIDAQEQLSPENSAGGWTPQWHSYMPAVLLVAAMSIAWLAHIRSGGMAAWGVSAFGLAEGRYGTVILHMFAHGELLHLLMNSAALLEIGALVVERLGAFATGWLRFLMAFALTGLSSMGFFLSFHPQGTVPMIGASGAVYGLLGLLLFIRLSEEIDRVPARLIPGAVIEFIRNNLFFLSLLVAGGILSGLWSKMAWEAHLGGFLSGIALGPWISPPLGPIAQQQFAKTGHS